MGMDVGSTSGGSMASPNVVPLIDILLVLIIIFMVITPLTPKGLDTLVPQPSPNQQQNQELENKTVVVQVLKDGKATLRFFGVQIVAHMDLPNVQNGDERVLSHLGRDGLELSLIHI